MPSQFDTFRKRLNSRQKGQRGIGFNYEAVATKPGEPTPGELVGQKLGARKESGFDLYTANRNEQTQRIAQDVAEKSAFQVPTDEFGIVQKELTNFQDIFTGRLKANSRRGDLALQTAEAKNRWHQMKRLQDLGQYAFTGGVTVQPWTSGAAIPGASKNNPGARAVALAMKAYRNGTPYVWGGNSLSRGIDCSGLVQQVYRQLGINLPRTTYQQAKHGKRVSVSQIRPGDLVFYNTGSRDPNGIGSLSHVAIYMGNGKIIEALNSRRDMEISNLVNYNGRPALVIRPY